MQQSLVFFCFSASLGSDSARDIVVIDRTLCIPSLVRIPPMLFCSLSSFLSLAWYYNSGGSFLRHMNDGSHCNESDKRPMLVQNLLAIGRAI